MFWTLIAIIATALITFLSTQHYYARKTIALKKTHKSEEDKAFHDGFKGGWDEGFAYGQRKANLERIVNKKTS